MNVTIFGATGTSGLLTVEKALSAGHHVTVFARNTSKITRNHPLLSCIEGELTDFDKIDAALDGANAVITLLGPMNMAKELPISNATKYIIGSMERNGVKRLVAAVSSSYRDPKDKFQFWFDFGVVVLKLMARNTILKDIELIGKYISESNLDWTMVRLPKLSNQSAKSKFNVGYTGDGKVKNFFLARADLASFLVDQLDDHTYLHKAPVVSN